MASKSGAEPGSGAGPDGPARDDRADQAEPTEPAGLTELTEPTGQRDGRGPVAPGEGPQSPTDLPGRAWLSALKRSVREFREDSVSDWAAALTYYGVLSIFPGLLVLVSALGLMGNATTDKVQSAVRQMAPGQIGDVLDQAITKARESGSTAGFVAIFGLLVAFWSASGYIAAFMRASNAIYDVPEGRPVWKTLPIRLGVTLAVGVMLVASALIVVFTGDLAEQGGGLLGVGSGAVTVWGIAKWPVLIVLVSLMFSLLYWASPNARQGGWRWISPGGALAVVVWLVVSAGFAFYVANFGSYNETYGAIASVVVFLIWLWLTNMAILLGAELDAELERARAIAAGRPENEEPFLELRDDRKIQKGSESGLG